MSAPQEVTTEVLVEKFLRWFQAERGATARTVEGYTEVLAMMRRHLADRQPARVTIDELRDLVHSWGHLSASTRAGRISVMRTFWEWCEDEGLVDVSPARRLRRPKLPKREARLLPAGIDKPLLEAAESARDRVALLLLLDYGVRCSELLNVRVESFDVARRSVTVLGKGQKERTLPLRGRILDELRRYLAEPLPQVDRPPQFDDYLLYPKNAARGTPRTLRAKRPLKRGSGRNWWYARLRAAGLISQGTTSGMNMHRARHSFAVAFRRATDIGLASLILGHSSPSVTANFYGHFDFSDLESGMDTFERRQGSDVDAS